MGPTAMNRSHFANSSTLRTMNSTSLTDPSRTTRREFLKTSGTALAGAALAEWTVDLPDPTRPTEATKRLPAPIRTSAAMPIRPIRRWGSKGSTESLRG